MLQAGGRVKAVAHDVGCESESQFSREYRRFFAVISKEGWIICYERRNTASVPVRDAPFAWRDRADGLRPATVCDT
jgi:AraC-like DNA-binding protein